MLLTVWNWLPAFQVVAETEHLPTASSRLRVAASALSRSITMLEDRLGRPLFARRGRGLVLNTDGRRLLAGITSAFAAMDDSIGSVTDGGLEGALYASVAGPLAQTLVVPALRELQASERGLLPYVYGYDRDDALRLLRARQIDVLFDSLPTDGGELVATFLGETANGVYCGRGHALFATRAAEEGEVLRHGFVATCALGSNRATDAFPADVERRVEMYVHQMSVALEACVTGHLLAVLPEFVARPLTQAGSLRQLAFRELPATALFAIYATSHANNGRIRAVVSAFGEALAKAVQTDGPDGLIREPVAVVVPLSLEGDDETWLMEGDALLVRGELRAARLAYDEARTKRRRSSGDSSLDDARLALRAARLDIRAGAFRQAEARCKDAATDLNGRAPWLAASLDGTAALAACFRGHHARARELVDSARGHATAEWARDRRPARRTRALVRRAEGNLLLAVGRPREAIVAYRDGATVSDAREDAWEHSIALFNLAEAYAATGERAQAREALDTAAREKEVVGDRWGLAHVHCLRANLALGERRAEEAIDEATRGLQLATDLGDPRLVASCNVALGGAHILRGEPEAALRAFAFGLREAEACEARAESIRALIGLSAAQLRRGKRSMARRHAQQAHALAEGESGQVGALQVATLVALADVATAEGRHADAASFYRDALHAREETDR
jgi:DNA-binding transcriptional LysR family regulator